MIGRTIKYIRNSYNLTQTSLAEKLNIGRSTLSDYEREKTNIDFDTLEKLVEECGFEILFRNKNTGESIQTKDIARKDIKYEQTKKT